MCSIITQDTGILLTMIYNAVVSIDSVVNAVSGEEDFFKWRFYINGEITYYLW